MKTKILYLVLLLLSVKYSFAQSPSWKTLINAPVADSGVGRYDDTYFINSTTGWIIQGTPYFNQNDSGKVYKTTDGGNSWELVNHSIHNYLRSVGFFNANTGFIGAIDDTLHPLYKTTNGGYTWTDAVNSIQGTAPKGICGISIINSSTAFASGRYSCPANVIKTTNAGVNWTALTVDTSLIRSIVDCHFWSADTGFIVGGYSSSNLYYNGKSVVIMTVNGGLNWSRVYISPRSNEWCWKIQFVNKQLGYVSIEREFNLTYYLKTTNGGLNWIEKPFMVYDVEGIGFLNENTGWIGGWGVNKINSQGPNYETTNGGTTWHLAGWGINMNRIRFLSDTLAYAVGKTVYKFTKETIGIRQLSSSIPENPLLEQNYPNPFNPTTNIKFEIPKRSFVKLFIYNTLGNELIKLVNEEMNAGSYLVTFDGVKYPSGVYFYRLLTEEYDETNKFVLLK